MTASSRAPAFATAATWLYLLLLVLGLAAVLLGLLVKHTVMRRSLKSPHDNMPVYQGRYKARDNWKVPAIVLDVCAVFYATFLTEFHRITSDAHEATPLPHSSHDPVLTVVQEDTDHPPSLETFVCVQLCNLHGWTRYAATCRVHDVSHRYTRFCAHGA